MNKKITISLFIVYSLSFIVFGLSPQVAMARLVPQCTGPCGLCDFFTLIVNIYDFIAFKLTPPVGAFMFLLAGVLFLFSGGSEERISQAKRIFVNVFFGLIFIYASWLIVHTLINVVGKSVEGFNPQSWNKFNCTAQ